MNKISFPLKLRSEGLQVDDLHEALQLLLDRGAILANDEVSRRTLAVALKAEHALRLYGEVTRKLVSVFQQEGRLQPSGEVDSLTAEILNRLLQELGVLDKDKELPSPFRLVTGVVRREDKLPLQGVRVRAAHVSESGSIRLGEDTSDAEGRYTIRYDALPGVQAINLNVSAIGDDGKTLASSQVVRNAKPLETINLTVPLVAAVSGQTIEGAIVFEHGQPAIGLQLRLYRRDFEGKATPLSNTTTLANGRYAFSYDAGNPAASLEVRAVQSDGKEVPLSKPLNNVTPESPARLNLLAPRSLQPIAAEYRRLSSALTPHVGEMAKLARAKEDARQQDIAVLNRATGWDARLIALASVAERLTSDPDVGLPSEAVYGLLRAGLPSDKMLLAQVEPEVVELAIKKVRDAGIVEMDDPAIAVLKTKFVDFANKTRLAMSVPGSQSTYGALLKSSGLPQDAQEKFASVYLKHRGSGAELWEQARKAGLDGAHIGQLQLQGKLAFLAGNSGAMTTRLLGKGVKDPGELAEQDFHSAAKWKNEIFEQAGIPQERRANLADADRTKLDAIIPPAYAGEKMEVRLDAYAEDMARKIRLSYPTQVLGRLLETDKRFELPSDHDATVKLVKNATAQGFRLGETPVSTFLKSRPALQEGLSDAEFQVAGEQVKVLQRVYQITPSNEAMPVLMSLDMRSAFDVMAYTEEQFNSLIEARYLEIYKEPAPAGLPELIRRRAQQVSSVTYNLFTIAKKLDSEPPVAGLSASVQARENVKNELIKHYPTMESLFGSMDHCECEHCRSVLSPAAYLVDLLQFVDTEPGVWGNFLAQWRATHGGQDYPHRNAAGVAMKPYDVLIERRPDLPHIALTCENTNTALPYIDIINEILEYYVAHGTLNQEAARDTGDATTADLLAEPQNVIRDAYDVLRNVEYPINLPFDPWIETVRRFCDYFERPLPQLLEAIRKQDDLFAPAEPFDRAAIFMESLGLAPAEVAIFTDPDPLANDRWHRLYGFPQVRPTVQAVTNTGNATLSVTNDDAVRLRPGLAYTYFDTSANAMVNESKIIDSIGAANAGGAGRTVITLVGVWTAAPETGDLLVCNAPGMLKSAKTLSRRIGVTYKEITEIIQTGFINPELAKLGLLYQLGLSASDARFYIANKALVPRDPATLSTEEQVRRLEAEAFAERLEEIAGRFNVELATLEAAIQSVPFDRVVVLADPNAGCDFDQTTLRYSDGREIDPIIFLRINLFVRLWRKLGWSIAECDRALTTFIAQTTPYDAAAVNLARRPLLTALIYLAHLKTLEEKLNLGKQARLKLLALWSNIATTGKKPLYAELFLKPSVLKTAAVFDHPLGKYLQYFDTAANEYRSFHWDPLQPENAVTGNVPLRSYVLALQGALGLTVDDVGRILADAGKSLDTAELSLSNVSLLYRYSLLAKGLKLTVRELLTLRQLSGLDPFRPLHADPLATLDQDHPFLQTLEFVKIVDEVRDSGLKIEDLDYLFRHRFDETGKYRPIHDAALASLKTLADGVRAILVEHAVPDDPATLSDEVLQQKLGMVLPADVVATFTAMMNGTAEFFATRLVASTDQLRPADFTNESSITVSTYDAVRNQQTLICRGFLSDAEKTDLKTRFGPKLSVSSKAVFDSLLDNVQANAQRDSRAFFDKHLLKSLPGVQPASGFLSNTDYDLLLAPAPAGQTEAQRQQRERQRRTRLAQAFLPVLQQRLTTQLIVQTMTAQTGASPALVESLVSDQRLLAVPDSLLDTLTATAERAVSATFWTTVDASGPSLPLLMLADADTGIKDRVGNRLKPPGANSARMEAYFQVAAPGAYRFIIELDRQNAEAELRFLHLQQPVFLNGAAVTEPDALGVQPNEFLELKAGVLYRCSLELKRLNGGDARLLVQGEILPKGPLSQLSLYPAVAIETAERATILLAKAVQLVQSLGLSEREIRYLLTHPGHFDGLSLSELPTATVGDSTVEMTATAQRFRRFRRLLTYARLKRELASGTDDLILVFEANGTTAPDRLERQVYPLIAALTRREAATVKASAEALVKAPAVPNFQSEQPLLRLWEMLQVVEHCGVLPASLIKWARIVNSASTGQQCFELARDLKETIKARFESESWRRVAQPIFDKLRQHQRDALASHVMQQEGFERIEQLFEYFLIDPGMEPVVQTSRIRLAIGSLQLFIQRSLLNLEPKVHPSTINANQWEWMKRYRVWEANRKIFLFPENWLEPEFRDDKTHLFNELEGALLQGDVSSDLVEDAFLNYLHKLDELARLDIVAMHIEDNSDPARRILHVFGRTYSQPHKYFYRRYAHQMWTPWEPVSAQIEGDHLAPVAWRDRLYLFWVTFIEKAQQATGDTTFPDPTKGITIPAVRKDVEAQLHWSEYLKGEWTTRESGEFNAPDPVVARGLMSFNPQSVFVHVSKEYDPADGTELGVFVHMGGAINRAFYLAGRNSVPEPASYGAPTTTPPGTIPENKFTSANTPRANRYQGTNALRVSFRERLTTEVGRTSPPANRDILRRGSGYTLLPCNNNLTALGISDDAHRNASNPAAVRAVLERGLGEIAALIKPVFYQDNRHTFFVEPDLSERTIEQWEEWVTRIPAPDPAWESTDWWREIVIIPEIPRRFPVPDPEDPWRLPIDPGSLIDSVSGRDWLVNPGSVVRFGDVLIGPTGQPGIEIRAGANPAVGRGIVNVNPASDLAGGSTIVLHDESTFTRSGLMLAGGGLNIVGGAGFNSALENNFTEMNRSGFGAGALDVGL